MHIGCSGWQYRDWREVFYPPKLPQRRWLEHYATEFETVEVNSTFYRLAKPEAVARWVVETPPEFVFAVKASRYLTHIRRLRDIEEGIARYYEAIAPLAESPKLGPVLWQLPGNFKRDEDRLGGGARAAAAWAPLLRVSSRVVVHRRRLEILRQFGAALVYGDHPERPWQPLELTADWTFVRFHYGHRGRRGNYSETELREWAARLRDVRTSAEVFAYFNNDWEASRRATRSGSARCCDRRRHPLRADAAQDLGGGRLLAACVARLAPDRGDAASARYRVIPVNPEITEVLGEPCLPRLPADAGIEVVDLFRRSSAVSAHVDEAIAIGAKAVWMQLGVIDHDAADRARAAGLRVVMDRCPAIELPRL